MSNEINGNDSDIENDIHQGNENAENQNPAEYFKVTPDDYTDSDSNTIIDFDSDEEDQKPQSKEEKDENDGSSESDEPEDVTIDADFLEKLKKLLRSRQHPVIPPGLCKILKSGHFLTFIVPDYIFNCHCMRHICLQKWLHCNYSKLYKNNTHNFIKFMPFE